MASNMLTGSSLGNSALQKTEDVLLAANRALDISAGSSAAAPTASVGEQHQKADFHYQQHPASQWTHLSQYINLQHLDSRMPADPCLGPGRLAAAAAMYAGSSAPDPSSNQLSNQRAAGGTAATAATCFPQLEKSQHRNQPHHHQQQQQRSPSPVIHLDSSSRAGSSDNPSSPHWQLPAAPVAAPAKRVRFELVAGGEGRMQDQQRHSKSGRTIAGSPEQLEDPYYQQHHLGMQDSGGLEQQWHWQEMAPADEAVGRRRVVVRRIGVRAQARKRMFKKATRRRRPQRSPLG
eukprot:gene3549-3818_t